MKALTCASYEYMKLMIAELQRQLNEIEESKGLCYLSLLNLKTKSKITKIVFIDAINRSVVPAPKPPPRRQNPFDKIHRPAPLPPNYPPPKTNSENQGKSIQKCFLQSKFNFRLLILFMS